jgi:hypothetical protein
MNHVHVTCAGTSPGGASLSLALRRFHDSDENGDDGDAFARGVADLSGSDVVVVVDSSELLLLLLLLGAGVLLAELINDDARIREPRADELNADTNDCATAEVRGRFMLSNTTTISAEQQRQCEVDGGCGWATKQWHANRCCVIVVV